MLGFVDISDIAHQLEDLFVAAKRDLRVIDHRAFELVFRSLDLIAVRVEELARGQATPAAAPADTPAAPATATRPARRKAGQSLRIAIEKLDRLTHLAPEMVHQGLKASERHAELRRVEWLLARLRDRVREARLAPPTQSRIAELGDYADALDVVTRRMRLLVTNVNDDQARLRMITDELRQHVIDLTMLPVGTVFDTFPRAVRDLARSADKEVELTMTGGRTEIEKRVLEKIADPLVHLVRNAIDHGLEPPAERQRAGKPPAGALLIAAEQQGNRCYITVRDDGRGIDPMALRAAAARKGIAAAADLEQWTDERLFNLIFEPGFSTRTEATDISGRGVGMDVVRVVADGLGGVVRVQSELGRGTTVVLDLPLSLVLLRVVLIDVNGDLTALPTSAIRRIVQIAPGTMPHGQAVEIDGASIPIAALSVLLGQPASGAADAGQALLIVETHEGRMGLLVDAVIEEQELVFQELRGPLGDHLTIAGAALLGNGEIVPILDVKALYQCVAQSAAVAITAAAPLVPAARSARVLVVEDSLVAAEMHRGILFGAGYLVEVAHDGVEALELLRGRDWDLVITDVDMPQMNGVELTVHLRADPRLRGLPVIIVSSRDSGDHRRIGFEAGADAYLAKGEFDQNDFLELVRRFLAVGRQDATP